MIKYAIIPGFENCGELMPFSHHYQWMEEEKDDDKRHTILIRAYEKAPTMWVGKIHDRGKRVINTPKYNVDITDVNKLVGPVEIITSLKEFLKGGEFEEELNDYEETTEEESAEKAGGK